MDWLPIVLTVVAGVAMGAINNVAGGAGVLGLVAFEHFFKLPLECANASTRVAAVAVGAFSCLGFVAAGRKIPRRAYGHALIALPGALLGAQLALGLPPLAFRGYLIVVIILLLRQQLRPIETSRQPSAFWLQALGAFLIGLHMGYVQVGTGLVVALALSRAYGQDMIALNAAKSIVVIVTAVTSATRLALAGAVSWTPAITLAVGCAIGSFAASKWSVRRGGESVRRIVLVIAALTLLEQLRQIVLLVSQ
ncbi:MAG: hypothetical protein CMJ88_04775 [Planctomycetes bacterium]|nr:hypothetical protein [Planctomycetota bacterium]